MSLQEQMSNRLRSLGVDLERYGGKTLIEALVNQEAIIVSVDTPHGPEWSYGWGNTPWSGIRKWAMGHLHE